MGIAVRNLDEAWVTFFVPGTQTASNVKAMEIVPFDGFITNVHAELVTAGVTGSQVVDLNKNGTTIFAAAAKITFTAAAAVNAYSALTSRAVSKGDKISLDVDSIHSGTAAVGLLVHMQISKRDSRQDRNASPATIR